MGTRAWRSVWGGASLGLLPLLATLGCGKDSPTTPATTPLTWETAATTSDDGRVLIEKVSYRSESLRIFGQVCRPKTGGPFPVMVWNHGGFEGLGGEWNGGLCKSFAEQGWAVIESAYRGEDGSDGKVEVCLGEVSDVLAMIDIALAQSWADRSRVALWGASHGGCITSRAFERGAPVRVGVDVFGPSDWTLNYGFWREQAARGGALAPAYRSLMAALEVATGGPPERVPAAYQARSPAGFAADLSRRSEPFMIVQGVEDPLVPPDQSCLLAARAGGFSAYHVSALPSIVIESAPSGCSSYRLDWLPGPRPTPSWPGSRYLLVYDSATHSADGLAGQAMFSDAVEFLTAKTRR